MQGKLAVGMNSYRIVTICGNFSFAFFYVQACTVCTMNFSAPMYTALDNLIHNLQLYTST